MSKTIDIRRLFEDDNFENWAIASFVNDEFVENLTQFLSINFSDELKDLNNDLYNEKLNEIFDYVITKFELDEQIVKEFNKTGLSDFHVELNNLEINMRKLETLEGILEKTNNLAESLGVPENKSHTVIVIKDDEEVSMITEDDDVQIISLTNKKPNEEPTKEVLDISNSLKYVFTKELLSGFNGAIDMPVFVKTNDELWLRASIQLINDENSEKSESNDASNILYDVLLENGDLITDLQGTHLASIKSALDFCKIYPIGTRVVSVYSDENGCSGHYSGIIAEVPSSRNSFRYLVFFDDGYVQYSLQNEVFLVFQQTIDNWKYMNEDSQEFVKNYIKKYPERPMVRMKIGQHIKIEYATKWCTTLIEKVDASLAFVCFENSHREWIYRGSSRIEALFKELVLKPKGKSKKSKVNNSNKDNKPVVEYTVNNTDAPPPRKIARKSTSYKRIEPDTDPYVNININDIDVAGTFITTLDNILRTRAIPQYKSHSCINKCIEATPHDPEHYKGSNPLEIPILSGWFRVRSVPSEMKPGNDNKESGSNNPGGENGRSSIAKRRKKRGCAAATNNILSQSRTVSSIYYVAPCGRRFRNISDLDNYLFDTKCLLTLDLFSFELDLRVNREFQVQKVITNISDISYGNENVRVPCVNSVDNESPHFIEYIPYRHISSTDLDPKNKALLANDDYDPAAHVGTMIPLPEDDDFMTCCDCTDGCKNRSKCACQQMTMESAKAVSSDGNSSGMGYQYKRLYQYHPGGIFECNSRCKCNKSCRNRVVQQGLWNKLQIFKTERKGWGIRTLHDIPRGAFVCIYAGRIFDEAHAVIMGHRMGDEYQAELDYIETLEEYKEGYESDVVDPDLKDDDEDNKMKNCDSDDEAKALLLADSDSESDDNESISKSNSCNDVEIIGSSKVTGSGENSEVQPLNNDVIMSKVEGNVGNASQILSKSGARRHTSMHIPKVQNSAKDEEQRKQPKFDIREYLGDPNPFIMDAKVSGNLGRYFNHSCAPNLFVQNVFITSHDLRYPEVAFFAKRNIEAGEEITWDYNYRVGSVKDKVLYCYCGSVQCRGRLL